MKTEPDADAELEQASPIFSRDLGNNAAQAVNIGSSQLAFALGKSLPGIPPSTEQPARNLAALLAAEMDSQRSAKIERRRAFFGPLFVLAQKNFGPTFSGPAASTSSIMRVFNAPGAMAFTCTPKGSSSRARHSTRRTTAASMRHTR